MLPAIPARLLSLLLIVCSAACGEARFEVELAGRGKADAPGGVDPRGIPRRLHGDEYLDKIQPVLSQRCAVCHSCYTAPCQLKLTSYDGLARGATKKQIYDPNIRWTAMAPTRLHVDARSPGEWQQKKGFFPIVHHAAANAAANMQSLLYRLMKHGREAQLARPFSAAEPTMFVGDAAKSRECPKDGAELDAYLADLPEQGMPFGCPSIGTADHELIMDWLRRGAPGPGAAALAALHAPSTGAAGLAALRVWEDFLNDPSPKMRLTARYLYEHLFLAELLVEGIPGEYYRLVRSRTAAPLPVDEIATVLPYDAPGGAFSYRLVKLVDTIVHKTHTVYRLDSTRLARLRELFIDSDWGPAPIDPPSADNKVAANPFVAFARIPARARYQFLLDDGLTAIMTFINGPVCYGQSALNVIRDHFLVFFVDPDQDLSVIDPGFLAEAAPHLEMPITGRSDIGSSWYLPYKLKQLDYTRLREERYAARYPAGHGLELVWDGDGQRTAVFTVYRHFDNGSVLPGAVGEIPKTVLLVDYPILERIHYDLVAGFDVFGNVFHQLASRQYMDNLRVEAEDNFLGLLPRAIRPEVRASWNEGLPAALKMGLENPLRSDRETRVPFAPGAPAVPQLVQRLMNERLSSATRGPSDPMHALAPAQSVARPPSAVGPTRDQAELEAALRAVAGVHGEFVRELPEVTSIRVLRDGQPSLFYTLARNREHHNVSFILLEQYFFDEEHDTLNLMRGFCGSDPNFFFEHELEDGQDFARRLLELRAGDGSLEELVSLYGVRRRDPRLWSTLDAAHGAFYRDRPDEAGLLDLSRYANY